MTSLRSDGSPPSKRRKVDAHAITTSSEAEATISLTTSTAGDDSKPRGIDRPISPPPTRRKRSATPPPSTPRVEEQIKPSEEAANAIALPFRSESERPVQYVASPIQLTRIKDLAPHQNVDTVGLADILGNPMIRQCWNFNFLFDIGFVMQQFDPDVRDLVKVKIVHGFWRKDDERRIGLMEDAERYPNLELISAYMPDPFGTHHSKMLTLIRHDDSAEVIVHTANMISRDWGNMTQAVWRSPLLPLQALAATPSGDQENSQAHPVGSGERFKIDLFRYLNAYGNRLKGLTQQLVDYNFAAIRVAFIGSAPSRQKPDDATPATHSSWGWLGLREILSSIPVSESIDGAPPAPKIFIQISSIATLGQTPAWLTHFQSVLSSSPGISVEKSTASASSNSKKLNFFAKRDPDASDTKPKPLNPTFNIIFPTAHEIRTSLDGYNSGASIHTKLQSPAQQKQLQCLLPLLCHWKHRSTDPIASDPSSNPQPSNQPHRKADRGPAAPHIKTYIRFSDSNTRSIDWALLTSANLSKQAWGELPNKKDEIWIQSWECGVVVWPALFSSSTTMIPVFGRDTPCADDAKDGDKAAGMEDKESDVVVGFRMPYDLPLVPYAADEVPWCASAAHQEPDWKGQVWGGYQPHK